MPSDSFAQNNEHANGQEVSISEDASDSSEPSQSLYTTEGSDEGDLIGGVDHENVIIEKNDRSLSEFHRWYKAGRLIIDPEWQRSYVWDRRRASKLIESFLMDIPVPVIYLAKNKESEYSTRLKAEASL